MIGGDRRKHDSEDFRIFQVMYVVSFTIGMIELGKTLHATWSPWKPLEESSQLPVNAIEILFIGAVLITVAVRFLWCVEALSRYMLDGRRAFWNEWNAVDCNRRVPEPDLMPCSRSRVTLWHYPLLLLHAFLFFMACLAASRVCSDGGSACNGDIGDVSWRVALIVGVLLTLNIAWLSSLRYRNRCWMEDGSNPLASELWSGKPIGQFVSGFRNSANLPDSIQNIWMLINLVTVVLLISVLVSTFPGTANTLWFGGGVIFLGSLLDLWITARFYVPSK